MDTNHNLCVWRQKGGRLLLGLNTLAVVDSSGRYEQ